MDKFFELFWIRSRKPRAEFRSYLAVMRKRGPQTDAEIIQKKQKKEFFDYIERLSTSKYQ